MMKVKQNSQKCHIFLFPPPNVCEEYDDVTNILTVYTSLITVVGQWKPSTVLVTKLTILSINIL